MVRFLHLADVHLDTAFEGRSAALRDHLRAALRSAFERAVDCAIDEDVHAVLLAGDLFDDDRLSVATEAFLVDQVRRLDGAGIDTVYVTGNHDPGGSGFRAARIDWPDHFHYIDERSPTTIELTGPDGTPRATVVAAGHVDAHEDTNLAARFPEADGPEPTIGLLHAHVTSASQVAAHDRYAPCTTEDLRAPGYDYWALGHIHTRQQVDEQAHAWYPGNLQGRSPRETGARGGLLVTLDDGTAPSVEFRPFAPTRWEHLTLDNLDDVETIQALAQQAQSAYRETAEADESGNAAATDWLLRVVLRGPCPLADELSSPDQVDELEQVLAQRLDPDAGTGGTVRDVEVRTRHLVPPVNPDTYRDETHLPGEVLALLDRARTDVDLLGDVAPDVLAGCSDDDPEARRAYLRSLLDGLDREAIARLVE
jgi:DNA repair exonuclease SbcCD nuclease subunit